MTAPRCRAIRLGIGPDARKGRSPEDDAPSIPYEDISDLFKEAIENAMREAWRRLPAEARRQAIDLRTAGETSITRLLRDELEKLRRDDARPVPDFNDDAFVFIPESEGVPDWSGRPLDNTTNKPDLVVRPIKPPAGVVRTSTYGMFIECKILDRSREHHGIGDYCTSGLLKFVQGIYAAVMPSGMMVAYVRNRKSVPSCLTPHLRGNATRYEVKVLPEARWNDPRTPPVYVSRHGRTTVVVGATRRVPGDIDIAHLWLDVA